MRLLLLLSIPLIGFSQTDLTTAQLKPSKAATITAVQLFIPGQGYTLATLDAAGSLVVSPGSGGALPSIAALPIFPAFAPGVNCPIVGGASGALQVICSSVPWSIDITAVVPLLPGANVWTGTMIASGASKTAPFRVLAADPPSCDSVAKESWINSTTGAFKICESANVGSQISQTFVDGETPAGAPNGTLATFTLAGVPGNSLHLYRNGLRQKVGVDYTLAGNTITFLSVSVPQTGDLILADYRF